MTDPTPTMRNLAVFLDGTWNTDDDDTNVFRLKSLCAETELQLRYYSKGVGTTKGEELSGGAFGIGIEEEVLAAYRWLMERYQKEDRIYVFGFSRGAFTARSLCGLISKCGLLRLGSPMSLKQLYARYKTGMTTRTIYELEHITTDLTHEEKWMKEYCQPIPIFFQGLWDTVGALGLPFGNFPKISRSRFAFLEVDLRRNYYLAYHALAVDEHRKAFAPTLWTAARHDNADNVDRREMAKVEQRWFPGAHADVGGGYPDGLLAQPPARWILSKAKDHGLLFRAEIAPDPSEAIGVIHNSFGEMLYGWYRALRLWIRYYRPIGPDPVKVGHDTTSNINETIDVSVFDRWRKDHSYRPQNIADWAARRGLNPETITDTVSAVDGSAVTYK
jgi:uncharacterized protein (DUF2235 family)